MERRTFIAASAAIAAVGLPKESEWPALLSQAMDYWGDQRDFCPATTFTNDDGSQLNPDQVEECHRYARAMGWYE